MDLFLHFAVDLLEPETEPEGAIKEQMAAAGLNIDEWSLFDRQYFGGNGFFAERVDNIPATFDEEGIPVTFAPGVHINVRTWAAGVNLQAFANWVANLSPQTPHRVFG